MSIRYGTHKLHPQVELDGIWVDQLMAPLLKALWGRGYVTQFSCQGGPAYHQPATVVSAPPNYQAQILFPDFFFASDFVQTTAEMLVKERGHITNHLGFHPLRLEPLGEFESSGEIRGNITFDHSDLALITELWS